MPLANDFSSLAQISKAGQNRLAGYGKEDGKPLPVSRKNKNPTSPSQQAGQVPNGSYRKRS